MKYLHEAYLPVFNLNNFPCKLQEERVKIDKEEAKHQAQKRKEAIERAKTLQYYQTDRVKTFHVRYMAIVIPCVKGLACKSCKV